MFIYSSPPGRPAAFGQGSMKNMCVLAGLLWNWNMVTTPLLLSFAGLLRIRAVYFPHDTSILSSRLFVSYILTNKALDIDAIKLNYDFAVRHL